MANPKSAAGGMHAKQDRKARGRTSITGALSPDATHPPTPQTQMTEVNRAVTASGNMNKHRGDRRDMSKTYSGTAKHAARGNTARKDVSTRAR